MGKFDNIPVVTSTQPAPQKSRFADIPVVQVTEEQKESGFLNDAVSDVKQTGTALRETFKKTKGKLVNIKKAKNAGEQGEVRSLFQGVGAIAGGVAQGIGDTFTGAVKTVLPESSEKKVKEAFIFGLEKTLPIAQQIDLSVGSPVQKIMEKYQNLDDKTKRDIDALLGIGSLATEFIGLGQGKKIVKKGFDESIDIAKQTGLKTKELIPKVIQKAVDDLESKYVEIATNYQGVKKKFNKAQAKTQIYEQMGLEATDPARVLAQQGIIPKQSGAKLDTLEQAEQFRESTFKLKNINREGIKEVEKITDPISWDEIQADAIARARTQRNIDAGTADTLENEIIGEIAALKKNYGRNTVSLSELDNIKSARQSKVKFDSTRPYLSDVNYIIGKTAQDTIEKTANKAGYSEVAQLNRHIGDRLQAADFLQSLDGKTVKGGRLQKYVFQTIGSTFGTSPLGKILGALGGDLVSDILISNAISNPVKRSILSQIKQEDPKAYKRAIEWLAKNKINPRTPLMLPAGKSSKGKSSKGKSSEKIINQINLPREGVLEGQRMLRNRSSILPSAETDISLSQKAAGYTPKPIPIPPAPLMLPAGTPGAISGPTIRLPKRLPQRIDKQVLPKVVKNKDQA